MSKTQEALKLALEALEVATTPLAKDRQEVLRAQAAIREALAEQPTQQQEPNVAICGNCLGTKRPHAADSEWKGRCDCKPPQPAQQQEPVDFASLLREAEEIVREKPTWKRFIDGTPLANDTAVWMTVFAQDVARRTSPPIEATPLASQRSVKPWVHATTWRGLTDEEWQEIDASLNGKRDLARIFVRAIEAKLKEKNT